MGADQLYGSVWHAGSGSADAVDLFLNLEILTVADAMDFYRVMASLYDAHEFKAPVTTLVCIFEDHVSS